MIGFWRRGFWLRFAAAVQTHPDLTDATPHLEHYVAILRADPEVTNAAYHHEPGTDTVIFDVHICYALTWDYAMIRARGAFHDSLRQWGGYRAVHLTIDSWPDAAWRA